MHARFQNTAFAAKSSPNSFKILGRSLQVQESEAAADTTLRLDSLSSPLSNSIGTKRKWKDQEADPLLSLRLGHSSSSSDSKGSSATASMSLSSAKEIEEASSMDLDLDFTLHLGKEKPASNHKPANLKMKELQVPSPEFDLELSLSCQSEITAVQQQANQFPTLGDMLRATNEGSTSRGWRPGFASSPALQALSSKETSSFLAHAPKKIIIPSAPHVLDLSSSSATTTTTTTTTTPISSGTCTSVLSQQLKPHHKSSSSSKLCQVEGCQKGARGASGRCISHGGGRRCQRHGCHKGAEGRTVYCKAHGGGRRCEFLGCTKSAEGRTDFCIAHGGGRRCSHEDCTRAARGRSGLCIRHGGGKRCQRENCTKSAEGLSGLCISHGGGRRCQSSGCTKGAQGSTMFCKAHGGGKRCTHPGCTKGAEGSTPFCKGHGGGKRCAFQEGHPCSKSVHGGTNFCVAHGGGKRCAVPECTKSARGRTDFCVRHGGGKRCKSEGCGKSAQGSTDFCKAHGGGKRCAWGHPETEYAGQSSSGPCTSFARGKTGLCALHTSLVEDNRVHGGDGSVLAVGYVDGDILFWDFSEGQKGKASNHAVKLQLSSAEKRLPVIVMHWCLDVTRKNCGGKLFIYGGDIIGSDEVLTMLALDWSSGLGGLKCVGRVDLTLSGSFADMVLSPIASSRQSGVFLFLLTNPGQLQAYDDTSLASLMSQKENNSSASPLPYPMVVPTMDPRMTVAVFAALDVNDKLSLALSEIVVAAKSRTPRTPSGESAQWPLTGGVPSHLDDYKLERLYIAGYQDGSVRIWDATYPCLSLIYYLKPNANGIDITGVDASVTSISFCSKTSCLAVGSKSGVVRLFKLIGHKSGGALEVVTNTDKKAHHLHQEDGPQWLAAYSFLSSPVCTLRFVQSTRRLAVGFKCGRVAMLDIGAPSVIFVTNSLSDTGSPIESLCVKSSPVPTDQNSISSEALDDLILCAMTKDGQTILFDGNSGKMLASCLKPLKNPTAIRMHIIENCYENSEMPSEKHEKKSHMINASESHSPAGEHNAVTETKFVDQIFENSLFLMCSEDALRLYSLKSLSQGSLESIMEVNIPRPCCWMGTLKKDGRECAVLLLYKTGHIDIRSFPNLEVVGESSLLSLLSWNFKPNMEKTVCSDDFGHVLLVNGCEVAILSFLAHANGFRLPESLPMLHDKVLAAAADATFSHFPVHKKNNDGTPKFLSGIIKGFRSSNEQKVEQVQDFSHLGNIFSSPPYLKPSAIGGDDEKIIELNIDDIEIDEPTNILPSTGKDKKEKKDKRTDKERLFDGASSDAQPKTRTVDEIKAKYRKAGETSAIASQAKDKLLERGEKLERISQRTAELQDGAENFASMAHELAKQMEKRKWWNI